MVKSYYGCSTPPNPRWFFGTSATSPRLSSGCINRILVHRGCFNPPHIAHLNFLRYVYLRANPKFNIVAATIVPLPDDPCRDKLDGTDDKLLFSFDERVELWEQDAQYPEWACVVDVDRWVYDAINIRYSLGENAQK